MDSIFLGETKQAFSSSSSSSTESKGARRQRSSQDISNTVIQGIASKHFIDMQSQDGCKTPASIDKVLQGEKSVFDEPAFFQLNVPDLPPLPLSHTERIQLERLLKQVPISIQRSSLSDILGLTVHYALGSISKAARADKNRNLYTILETTKKQFCRYWLIGTLSQATYFKCKSDLSYTPEEFFQNMDHVLRRVQTQSHLNCVPAHKKHYEDASHAIAIILKLSKASNPLLFLQTYSCYQMKELTPWLPEEIENLEEEYQGVQAFIDFVICAFENTAHFQTGADKITPVFRKFKTIYDFIHQAQLASEKQEGNGDGEREASLLMQIVEIRKCLLNTCLELTEYQSLQKSEIDLMCEGKKFKSVCFLRSDDGVKCQNIAVHYACCYQLFDKSMFLLEKYAKHVVPAHVTVHACLIRTDVTNKFFCSFATGANSLESQPMDILLLMNDPSMAFLGAEDRKAFLSFLMSIRQDVNKLFTINAELMKYAQGKLKIRDLASELIVVLEYKRLYPMIGHFLDTINPALDALQKAHSCQLIQLVDRLSIETCRIHQKAILNFFENLLLQYMKHFFMLALLKEDLDTLLPTLSTGRSIPFSETSIVSYFCMLEFEEYFLAKIAPSAPVGPLATLEPLLVHVASDEKASPELDGPEGEVALESLSVVAETPMEKKPARKHKKKGRSEKNTFPNRPAATLTANLTSSPTHLSPRLIIRKGEKLDRIFKMLGENGLAASYSKGGHTIFANSNGYKVTVPVHSPHLSNTVRRSIVERVNNMPRTSE